MSRRASSLPLWACALLCAACPSIDNPEVVERELELFIDAHGDLQFSWRAWDAASSYRIHERRPGSAELIFVQEVEGTSTSVGASLYLHANSTYVVEGCQKHRCWEIGEAPLADILPRGELSGAHVDTSSGGLAVQGKDRVRLHGRTGDWQWSNVDLQVFEAVEPGSLFGEALAWFGDTLVVGASGARGGQGAAYLYTLSIGFQSYRQEFTDEAARGFGRSLAVAPEAELAFIGAPGTHEGAGAVYTCSLTLLEQPCEILDDEAEAGSLLGAELRLSLDSSILAVGAHGAEAGAGLVRVYARDGDQWGPIEAPARPALAPGDWFGHGVGLTPDGTVLAVGAPGRASEGVEDAGAVYIYTRSGEQWSEPVLLEPPSPSSGALFGAAVALTVPYIDSDPLDEVEETVLVVGAPASAEDGKVYTYAHADGQWSLRAELAGDSEGFGSALSLTPEGLTLTIGSRVADDGELGVVTTY